MSWVFIIIGAVIIVVVLAAAYSMIGDPEEVDHEEAAAVGKETAAERERIVLHERAEEETERLKEMEEFPSGN